MQVPKLKPQTIIQALALFDQENSSEYGLALWAALHEVDLFYRLAHAQIEYRRFYIAPSPPSSSLLENISRAFAALLQGEQVQTAPDLPKHEQVLSFGLSELLQSSRRTYDQRQLARIVRRLIDPGLRDHLMIITDRPITPPRKWRYIIWETISKTKASVISAAPLDPEYWRDRDPDRVMRIKTRTRNAAISITGELIGLQRCANPTCFLFDNVDSVTVLDEMHAFGAEHHLSELSGYGFDEIGDPTLLQPAKSQPLPKRAL